MIFGATVTFQAVPPYTPYAAELDHVTIEELLKTPRHQRGESGNSVLQPPCLPTTQRSAQPA